MTAPGEVIEVPGQPHTFGLAGARNMLCKLEWEVAELERADAFVAFRAFNAAVTAWHMIDWVWCDLPREAQERLGDGREAFPAWCEHRCPELRLCRLIANASKHSALDRRRPDRRLASREEAVRTVLLADLNYADVDLLAADDPLEAWRLRLIVRDGNCEHAAGGVFARALAFWRDLIERELPAPSK